MAARKPRQPAESKPRQPAASKPRQPAASKPAQPAETTAAPEPEHEHAWAEHSNAKRYRAHGFYHIEVCACGATRDGRPS